MRASLAYAIVAMLLIAVQPAGAITQLGIPFITSCGFVHMEPFSDADLTIIEFNSFWQSSLDFEAIDIDFPAYADGLHLGASTLGLGLGAASSEAGGIADAIGSDGGTLFGSAYAAGEADATGLGLTATANVLPFGPVNLAFPDISQTVFQRAAFARTYFYIDTIPE